MTREKSKANDLYLIKSLIFAWRCSLSETSLGNLDTTLTLRASVSFCISALYKLLIKSVV